MDATRTQTPEIIGVVGHGPTRGKSGKRLTPDPF